MSDVPTVVAVGNGPGLLKRARGEQIDAHDVVLRMNNFETEKFAEFAGERITHWATTFFHNVNRKLIETRGIEEVLLTVNHYPLSKGWSGGWDRLRDIAKEKEIRCAKVSASMIRLYNRRMKSSRPSTGIASLLYLLDQYPVVSIVGYDHFNAATHHYFKDDDSRPPSCPHSGNVEACWVGEMIREGRLVQL